MKRALVRNSLCAAAIVSASLVGGTGHAFIIDLGNPDVNLRWGNTVRYAAGWRVESRDSDIANLPNSDEGDYAYDRHDMVTNRLDVLTELDFSYKRRMGFRVSAAAWRDFAFNDDVKTNPLFADLGSYDNNRFSNHTKRFGRGLSGEVLDAYLFGSFNFAGIASTIKAGRHAELWGESVVLSAHSVSYAQAPSDGFKGLVNPGADAKELALPVGQVSGAFQITPELTVLAQYFYEWKPTRLPEGGTYLAGTDFILEGPDRFALGPNNFLRNQGIDEPDDSGDWGIGARWRPSWFGGTIGLYYREFTERTPTISMDLAGGTYRAVYPENAKLMGLSVAKGIGGVSLGFELVHRKDTALNSSIRDGASEGARGDTWHALLNGIAVLGPNAIWDQAAITAELAYSRWDKVTSGERYFNRCRGGQDADAGCVTKDAWQAFFLFSPSWVAVRPGWDVSARFSLSLGLDGNGAVLGGGNEDAGSYSIGATLTYNQQHDFGIAYNDYLASNKSNPAGGRFTNGSQIQDRGWVVLTYKGSF